MIEGLGFYLFIYLFIYLFFLKILFVYFLERGEEKEKEKERNTKVWLPLHVSPTEDMARNPGMCPD